jgi:HK97 family phage portal protein
LVNGSTYQLYQFLRLLRKSKNGSQGVGILTENYEPLKVIFNTMRYEGLLVSSGGNKKGFIKSENRLSPEAVAELKRQWNDMYRNNNSNCVVLNNGLQFQESANTSVEMQLNENKKTNAVEVCRMFNMPENILNGTATDEEYQTFIKITILPIISQFETALNNALLNNDERALFYFKFDTKELLKGDLLKRMTAYQIGINSGVMQIDEARYNEDLAPLGLDFIKLGLQDVLYNPTTKEIYTPNTNQTKDTTKGGEVDNEDRNKSGSSDN